jgi:tetratricopeptide (TPR) repeat protein
VRQPSPSMKVLQAHILLCSFLIGGYAAAEVRTITATGEYRMGDNDTRIDAKRLALLDAKRLALEQAGTYLESITEVKNLQVSHDELRAYTAGIAEVIEQTTKDVMEGTTHIVRVEVTAKIDPAVIAKQVGILRTNEIAKKELLRARDEADFLRQELEVKTRELAAIHSRTEAESVTKQRQLIIVRAHVNELIQKVFAIQLSWMLKEMRIKDEEWSSVRPSALKALARAQDLVKEALGLDPSNAFAQNLLVNGLYFEGLWLAQEKNYQAARDKFREAIRLNPKDHRMRGQFALVLSEMEEHDEALSEARAAIALNPNIAVSYVTLGHVLLSKGDVENAVAEFRKAISISPNSPFGHMGLSLALERLGQKEEAQLEKDKSTRLLKSIVQEKDFEDARSRLGLGETKPRSR